MITIKYQGHFQRISGMGWTSDGMTNGRARSNRLMQALQIKLVDQPPIMKIIYDVRFPGSTGWVGTVSNGALAGKTDDPDKYIIGVAIDLADRTISNKNLHIFYKVYDKNKQEWTESFSDGKALNTTSGIEAIQITISER